MQKDVRKLRPKVTFRKSRGQTALMLLLVYLYNENFKRIPPAWQYTGLKVNN